MPIRHLLNSLIVALTFSLVPLQAAEPASSGTPVTRLIFQDHAAATLRWTDVHKAADGALTLTTPKPVSGFKTLDPAKQKLVQMAECGGCIVVGVRDDAEGQFESGWILADTGVEYEDHGEHGHWTYPRTPVVWDSRLNNEQGNPAHLYVYDNAFYLANDRRNGYTRIDPLGYVIKGGKPIAAPPPAFHSGGGNHITMAVAEGKVGYGAWIDGAGPNRGRVDVTAIHRQGNDSIAYSFHLPAGGLHGAIACEGKIFFAPADGVAWVAADLRLRQKPDEIQVHTISLGQQDDKPRRTGAFTRHKSYVVFTTGRDEKSSLILLDARLDEPQPIEVPLQLKAGQKAVSPRIITASDGRVLAFVFHDHEAEADVADELSMVELDPNRDGACTDAQVLSVLAVGPSAVEGHFGHHDVEFDADGRWAFFTNPGDGTISALSLKTLGVTHTFPVSGRPTALVAYGGHVTDD